jgi:hypothetical protein
MPIRTWLHRNSMLDTAPKKTRAEVTVGTPVVELTPSKNAALTREWVFWCRSMILKLQAGRRKKKESMGYRQKENISECAHAPTGGFISPTNPPVDNVWARGGGGNTYNIGHRHVHDERLGSVGGGIVVHLHTHRGHLKPHGAGGDAHCVTSAKRTPAPLEQSWFPQLAPP